MITFITAFKKFKSPYDMIQQSAMYSWAINSIPVIAPNNEVGLKEKCPDIAFIEGVKRARELGYSNQSPIVSDLIAKALPLIKTEMVAFINSDVIITKDFVQKLEQIIDKYGYDIFMIGSRYNIQLNYHVNSPETYDKVLAEPRAPYDPSTSSEIFISSKFFFRRIAKEMPEFIMGRYCWDNWLHLFGELNVPKKLNCTQALPVLHCEHGYAHIKNQEGSWGKDAPSSQYNQKLWQSFQDQYGTPRINHWPKVEL
jgi:hypothetical protein